MGIVLLLIALAAALAAAALLPFASARREGSVPRASRGVEDSIDLHLFVPRDVLAAVEVYLDEAVAAGLREVRLIHGKGRGVQRARIRELLERHARVERFEDAPLGRGGWGATLVWLRSDGVRDDGPPRRP